MKKLLTLALLAALALTFSGCEDTSSQTTTQTVADTQASATQAPTESPAPAEPQAPEPDSVDEYTFGIAFIFDDLEITFFDDIEWVTIENRFNDNYGADVARVPMTITNQRDETHGLNMFNYTLFGPDGTRLDTVSAMFMDHDVAWAGDMRSGATLSTYMHFLYDGDGDYFVEFSRMIGPTTEVRIPLAKN